MGQNSGFFPSAKNAERPMKSNDSKASFAGGRAVSSVVEHYLDTVAKTLCFIKDLRLFLRRLPVSLPFFLFFCLN
jgi:hypothetical protein